MHVFLITVLFFAGSLKAELASLVDTERAFARLSVDKGTRDGFLANLSDESIIFRPNAVRGKAWFESNSAAATILDWQPAFADIAGSGDLGYTTGPWQFRRTPADPPSAFGHYVTVWRKQAGGSWKIAVDIGISHESVSKPASVESPAISTRTQTGHPEKDIQNTRASLLAAERSFPQTPDAYAPLLSARARLYRNDSLPFIGTEAIRAALAKRPGHFAWNVQDAAVSSSLDFGYAYGTVEFRPADPSKPIEKDNYLRIWKKQDRSWRVILDLLS